MTTLYRAADSDDVRVGYSFAAERSDAEAYRANPGFGGDSLYRTRVSMARVCDLTSDPWETLSDLLGESVRPARYQHHFARTLTADTAICERLAAMGYDWATIIDDYPEGCVTYVPLTADAAEAAECEMDEIE